MKFHINGVLLLSVSTMLCTSNWTCDLNGKCQTSKLKIDKIKQCFLTYSSYSYMDNYNTEATVIKGSQNFPLENLLSLFFWV